MAECYVSVDSVAPGPVPASYRRLSLGASVGGKPTRTVYAELRSIIDHVVQGRWRRWRRWTLEALEALEASEFAWSRRTRRRPAYPALRPARERRFRFRNSRGDEFERLLSLAAGGVYNTLPSAAARSTLTATSARPP